MTAQQEREAVLRFLRKIAKRCDRKAEEYILKDLKSGCEDSRVSASNMLGAHKMLCLAADAIERGDHIENKG